MKWITRERARVDRIACPWLIARFIDPKPEFLFVPAGDVLAASKREHAIPYDIPDVELGHHGPQCSFDAFIDRYELADPALATLAAIVRGAGPPAPRHPLRPGQRHPRGELRLRRRAGPRAARRAVGRSGGERRLRGRARPHRGERRTPGRRARGRALTWRSSISASSTCPR